jgi:hypothetical protein
LQKSLVPRGHARLFPRSVRLRRCFRAVRCSRPAIRFRHGCRPSSTEMRSN